MMGGNNQSHSRSGGNHNNRNGGGGGNNNGQGHQSMNKSSNSQNNSRPGLNSNSSEGGGSIASSMFSNSQAEAPSSLGGATSVTGGQNSPGKDRNAGFGIRVENVDNGGGDGATLGSIANEMIDGRVQNGNASSRSRNDTVYEDAREEPSLRSNQSSKGEREGSGMNANNVNTGTSVSGRSAHDSTTPTRMSAEQTRSPSKRDGRDNEDARANDNSQSAKSRGSQRDKRQQHQQQQPQSNDGQSQPQQSSERVQEHRASITTVDSARSGAGYGNASLFEQTDAASFIGQDPIAIATDFNRKDADAVFLSSEMGSGANRQPVTRFRIHSVNLNVHSPVLSEMSDDLPDGEDEVQLEEDSATLKLLFGLMYNSSAPSLGMNEWQVVLRLARCAQKYDFARAKEVAAAYFTEQEQLGALSPFMTYAFAVQYKLPALEEAAAERSVRYDIHRLPELVFNMMGFAAFQQLASFHTRRQSHYQDILNNISIDPKELSDQCYQTGGVCVIAPWNRLKQKLAWPRQAGRDGSKRPPEPADVIRKLVTEIGQIDCGTCSRALVEAALQAQLALESMPSYSDKEEAF